MPETHASNPPGPLANLLLAGVGKAGTTSLFWYLGQHPDICRATAKETRYFLPLSAVDVDMRGPLPPVETYASYFAKCAGERYRMEATPHYFHGGEPLIRGIRELLGSPRIVIILREQVSRTVSTYRFAKSMLLIPRDEGFEEFVGRAIAIRRRGDQQIKRTRPYWSVVAGGDYATHLAPWLDEFDESELRVLFFDDLIADPKRVTRELCDWLDIDPACAEDFDYTVENRSVPYRFQALQRFALAVNSERLLRNHPRLKGPFRAVYYRLNGARRSSDEIDPATVELLRAEFADSNARLAASLAARGYSSVPDWVTGRLAGARRG